MAEKKAFDELVVGDKTDAKINSVHPLVLSWMKTWRLNRAFREGQHGISQIKKQVLPPLSKEQEDEQYEIYFDQAILYSAVSQTANAWDGMIYRKDPIFQFDGKEPTPEQQKILDNITDTGMSATELLEDITDEDFQVNRYGVLLDYPTYEETQDMSRKEQMDRGMFSNALTYRAEHIINWHMDLVNGKKELVLLVLKEVVSGFDTYGFGDTDTVYYRVLTLEINPESETGYAYRQRLFKDVSESKENKEYSLIQDVWPTMDLGGADGVKYLTRIPFWVFNSGGREQVDEITSPLLDDITQINKGHFRNSADQENELHVVTIKTIIAPGGIGEDAVFEMGGVVETPFPDNKPYIMEAKNKSPITEDMRAKEEQMAYLGARALGSVSPQITAETARIMATGEESILGGLVNTIAEDFADMLNFKMLWDLGVEVKSSVTINTDFYEETLNPQDLVALFSWLQAGGGSFETYFSYLKKRGMYTQGQTPEKELEQIKETQKEFGVSTDTVPLTDTKVED